MNYSRMALRLVVFLVLSTFIVLCGWFVQQSGHTILRWLVVAILFVIAIASEFSKAGGGHLSAKKQGTEDD